mmetsp:Transcript_5144/g.9855  ORF Transcript_5144/g.9855 Transcript_5144/m.9855 type:complete len:132 (+) Transcript_5144:334-729(+)
MLGWPAGKKTLDLLEFCYTNVFETILTDFYEDQNTDWNIFWPTSNQQFSVCLPAIGCGYNGYPVHEACATALDCMYRINDLLLSPETELYIEIRFRDSHTFHAWQQEQKGGYRSTSYNKRPRAKACKIAWW